jgi:hypothetical protein
MCKLNMIIITIDIGTILKCTRVMFLMVTKLCNIRLRDKKINRNQEPPPLMKLFFILTFCDAEASTTACCHPIHIYISIVRQSFSIMRQRWFRKYIVNSNVNIRGPNEELRTGWFWFMLFKRVYNLVVINNIRKN